MSTENQQQRASDPQPKKVGVITETPVMPKIEAVPDSDTLPATPTVVGPRENRAIKEGVRD